MECCLSKGELLKLSGGTDGLALCCRLGAVWLTCGDGTDYLISAGRSFTLPPSLCAIVEALETAEFHLADPVAAGDKKQGSAWGVSLLINAGIIPLRKSGAGFRL